MIEIIFGKDQFAVLREEREKVNIEIHNAYKTSF
jgi:hypothetical protein